MTSNRCTDLAAATKQVGGLAPPLNLSESWGPPCLDLLRARAVMGIGMVSYVVVPRFRCVVQEKGMAIS